MSFNVADFVGELAPCDTSLTFSAKLSLWCLAMPTTLMVIALAYLEVKRRVVSPICDAARKAAMHTKLADLAVQTANTVVFLVRINAGAVAS